jgi:hypothetical protein
MWTPWSYLHQRLDDHNWDYEAVLRKAGVTVEFEQTRDILDYFRGTLSANSYKKPKATLYWKQESICIGCADFDDALRAAALYIELYQRGISPSLCKKLIHGYLTT